MDETKLKQATPSFSQYKAFPIDLLSQQDNELRRSVSLRTIIEKEEFISSSAAVPIVCGYEAGGQPNIQDLCQFPHLLIGGDAGSGKSSFLHSLLLSIFFSNSPVNLKLFLVDTKREFESYQGIPHLAVPVITNAERAIVALDWLLREMLRRYAEMADVKATDFDSYCNALEKLSRKKHPRIVFIVDEFKPLMEMQPLETENLICRIAQLGRWAGIHLILSSQHMIPEVFTKLIKANIHSRVAFHTASPRSSRIVMDCEDAVDLRHPGEMILSRHLINSNFKMKAPYVTTGEIHLVTAYLRNHYGDNYDEDIVSSIQKLILV